MAKSKGYDYRPRPKDTHSTQGIPKLRLFGSAYPLDLAKVDLTHCHSSAGREFQMCCLAAAKHRSYPGHTVTVSHYIL